MMMAGIGLTVHFVELLPTHWALRLFLAPIDSTSPSSPSTAPFP